jgi:hypothetical protein
MHLQLVRHLWGVTEPLATALPKFKAQGFTAIETPVLWMSPEQRAEFRDLLAQHQLGLVVQIFTGAFDPKAVRTPEVDLESLKQQAADALTLKPLFINAHSGYDAWTLAEMRRFYQASAAFEASLPVPLVHETHRGRCFYSPWIVRELLPELPKLRFTADFSHWCCVAERLIDDQIDIIKAVARQTHHIHARVGHSEGPQVNDPRAPEWAEALAAHERWWDLVWDAQQAAGMTTTTLCPEFGPAGYMQTLPFTNVPVADLMDICTWQAKRQAERFAKRPQIAKAR